MMVERRFLAMPRGCLRFVIVVFPDHTHLLIFTFLKAVVESETEITLNWFDDNQMQANPGKFQAIVGGKKTLSEL